jgi:hypothetical protein
MLTDDDIADLDAMQFRWWHAVAALLGIALWGLVLFAAGAGLAWILARAAL